MPLWLKAAIVLGLMVGVFYLNVRARRTGVEKFNKDKRRRRMRVPTAQRDDHEEETD